MSWEYAKVAVAEENPELGGMHVIGLSNTRHCGCACYGGMRMDKMESTFLVRSCDDHEAENNAAFHTFKTMPPSKREALGLYAELLDREVKKEKKNG